VYPSANAIDPGHAGKAVPAPLWYHFHGYNNTMRLSQDHYRGGDQDVARILIVEDNEMNRDMLSRRLSRKGFEVVLAEDGARGVDMATSESPDLILMDMSLPVIDGWEATQKIKSNESTSNIPIIALTAHAMESDREKALAAGCDDYDTKPVELPRLLDKINHLLGSAPD